MSLFGWLLAADLPQPRNFFTASVRSELFVLPFVLAFFLVAQLSRRNRLAAPPATGVAFAFHVTLSILAYAAFGLSCVLALSTSANNACSTNTALAMSSGVCLSLDLLDRMSQSSVLVGLISIAVGTVLGFVWVGPPHRKSGITIPNTSSPCSSSSHTFFICGSPAIPAGAERGPRSFVFLFCDCHFQLHRCESIFLALAPLFLGIAGSTQLTPWKLFSSD